MSARGLARRAIRRLRAVLARERVERELEDELRTHLELDAAERVRRGAPAAAARRDAAVAFGGYDAVAEACRDVRGVGPWETAARSMRQAARSLGRSPAFAATAAGVLALGVGAATAVFSIAEGVVLRPLPYASAEHLYSVYERADAGAIRPVSYPLFMDWERAGAPLAGLAYIRGEALGVHGEGGTRLLLAGYASERFFETLGTPPALGRVWDAEEARTGARVAVLSDVAWRESFDGDPGVVGRTIGTEQGPAVVIGVMPPEYRYPGWAELWLPLEALTGAGRHALAQRDLHVDAQVIGRVAPGSTPEAAAAALGAVGERIAERHADARGWTGARFDPIRAELMGDAETRIAVLAGAVLVLLLIACTNLAGLLIARGSARSREVATRLALGAGRGRVVRELVAEALVLGGAGGAAGAVLGAVAVRVVATAAPGALPRLAGVSADGRAIAFAVALGCVTAVLFGSLPALRTSRVAPMELLRSGRGAVGGRGVRLRSGLVAAEVALATLLVVGAGLLLRTLGALDRVPLGVEPEGVVAIRIEPPARYDTPERALALYAAVEEAARNVSDVRDVALVNHLPLSGTAMVTPVLTGRATEGDDEPQALVRTISPGFSRTLGATLTAGREFTDEDVAATAPVAIVNETLAAREWPGESPLGRSVRIRQAAQGRPDFGQERTVTVVGVLGDVRAFGPSVPPSPEIYVPISTMVWPNIFLAVRTTSESVDVVAEQLRRALIALDPDIPVAGPGFQQRVRPLTDYQSFRLRDRTLNAAVLASFAAIAFALAAVGVFGIVAYLALQRQREFGLRMSLGARPADVVRMVVGGGIKLVLAGTALGLIAAIFATRLLQGLLFGVAPGDVRSFAVAAALFLAAGVLASAVPAIRVARVEPGAILRTD